MAGQFSQSSFLQNGFVYPMAAGASPIANQPNQIAPKRAKTAFWGYIIPEKSVQA
jgi:hypothetical protein